MTFSLSIGGAPVTTSETFDVINPANGEVAAQVSLGTVKELDAAVAAAKAAFPAWAATPDAERADALNKIADLIEANAEELSALITKEQGKPQAGPGANFEIQGAVGWTRVTAGLSLAPEVIIDNDEERVEIHREPVGVVASITPWNWPLMIAIWHIMPAIRIGCPVVIKPSPYTPLSTLRLVELVNEAGILPAGVLNAVTGDGEVGDRISTHPDIAKITFTGSIPTGRRIMERAGASLKKLTLELGGNDAGIILPGTDISKLVEPLFWGTFINAGQTCSCLKRLYVHEDDVETVGKALAEFAANIPVGNGMDEGVLIGPMTNEMQYNKVVGMVEEAKAKGATVLAGGEASDAPGYIYPITILSGCTDEMSVVYDEQFGNVVPIIAYKTLDEAIEAANGLEVGLGASVWGDDPEEAAEVAKRVVAGTRWVNRHAVLNPMVPMGGVKQSGIGVEFSEEGLREYTTVQVLSIAK
ncbi:aldehyde dehydrogenase family protein [Cognatishimia sp. SS12]|uniref:aldehyde dehydrogenase family protein n=1 Tax=Cognatishimia sp. SS12 TaxID=2979465 RepID=UPI00232BCF59|nr:aldehyde dehydrogenase family protein [Cognatishimia sp. SS12]MDC0739633.1 aldehyde dehydrogenase family protein [Cognatishimia sp. SS12]